MLDAQQQQDADGRFGETDDIHEYYNINEMHALFS